jgi:hypothetical protein
MARSTIRCRSLSFAPLAASTAIPRITLTMWRANASEPGRGCGTDSREMMGDDVELLARHVEQGSTIK